LPRSPQSFMENPPMTLRERVNEDMKSAMKAREA
jgi:hypothetical protein